MKWDSDRSIGLSQACIVLFSLLLVFIDIGAYWLVGIFIRLRGMGGPQGILMTATVYLCSVPAWTVLWRLWRLLSNMKKNDVFIKENVSMLRSVSWCCFTAAVICLVSALYYLPFLIVAIAAAFMGLIVRIVKNAFQQAILMKDELDFTV